MDKTKPFGLVIPKKTKAFQGNKTSIFDSDSDDEQPARKKLTPIPQAKPLSKKLEQKELCEDPSIYEYDSIYDDMKAQEVAKVSVLKDSKPSRYIDTLLKAADKRKKEYERRIERKVQVEREKEGDKFKDKEAFVTSSYKKKMQEMEEAEERERRENIMNDMMDVTKQNDLSGFYRHFLKQSVGEEKVPVFGGSIKEEPKSDDEDEKGNSSAQGKKRKNFESDEEKNKDLNGKEIGDNKETKLASKASHSCAKMFRKGRGNSDDEDAPNPPNNDDKIPVTAKEAINVLDPNLDLDSDIVSSCEEDEIVHSKSKEDSSKEKLSVNNSKVCSDGERGSSKNKSLKNIRKRTNSDSSDSSESSKENEHADSPVNETSLNGHPKQQSIDKVEDSNENEKPKPKRNMLEKRTVGETFAAAQARYFQRLAARNG